jgi:hypothetical protein
LSASKQIGATSRRIRRKTLLRPVGAMAGIVFQLALYLHE